MNSSTDDPPLPETIRVDPVDYSTCIATTKQGNQCANKPKKGSNYCTRHHDLFRFDKPSECPICFESMADEHQPLPCGHWAHKNCILQ